MRAFSLQPCAPALLGQDGHMRLCLFRHQGDAGKEWEAEEEAEEEDEDSNWWYVHPITDVPFSNQVFPILNLEVKNQWKRIESAEVCESSFLSDLILIQ